MTSTTSRPARAFEDPVADLGRLQHEIAFVHHERLALILVDDAHPATPHIDHLERDPMVMDPVGDQPAFRNGDVRCNVAPAEPARDEVAIEQASAALA